MILSDYYLKNLLINSKMVLILVLMDDTLWPVNDERKGWMVGVLILVLMDDTLWLLLEKFINQFKNGLNPCFNGWYSLTGFVISQLGRLLKRSLNPCFNGWYSLTLRQPAILKLNIMVLILVLMDDTLWLVCRRY